MDSEEPQQSAAGEPVGPQLKRAREKCGLSQKDVADAQHLRVSIIEAIEDGHYDQIDSELFLKGYVRVYAQQVGADADALIKSLDLELEPLRKERAKREQENPLVNIERRRRKKRQVAKALGTIVIFGALAFAAWKLVLEPRMAAEPSSVQPQSQNEQAEEAMEDPQVIETDSAEGVRAAEDSGPTEFNTNADVDSSEVIEESPALSGSPELVESPEPTQSADLPKLSEDPEVAEVSVNDQALGGDVGGNVENNPASNELAAAEPVVQPDPVFEESAQPESVAASTRLEMSFMSDCWVQVTDSSGARLVASLQRNGDQVSVSGRAPLDVVIGAVDAVGTVRFGGEPVDLSSFRVVNNRTEFTLTL